ncbi:ComEA family DNA-binding protein [Streptomyces triticirhizae]|uniref:ComEA family DNA-binding protein n=1 Tax=Streptomyces triticirhizae TaxID=2483353 RepID=UPI001F15F602|nr:ComEA family DNA-binding protein [Streptomyces triticirhizae]
MRAGRRRGPGETAEPPADPGASPDAGVAEGSSGPLTWRQRLRLGLGERVPAWLRGRCGLEPRSWLAVLVVLVVAVGFAVHHFWSERARAVPVAEPSAAVQAEPAGEAADEEPVDAAGAPGGDVATGGGDEGAVVVVDVAGDVRAPGLYRLPTGSRVADALEAAGGPVDADDAEALNQARLLIDGEQLLVGEEPPLPVAAPSPEGGLSGGPGGQPAAPVSINSATSEQLQDLPGIGPVLAGEIVAYRQQRGGFTAVDQLGEVSGIGDRRLAELRDRVTL